MKEKTLKSVRKLKQYHFKPIKQQKIKNQYTYSH